MMIFPFSSGFLRIDSIAPETSNHSPNPAPRPAHPIASHAAIGAYMLVIDAGSIPRMLNAMMSPYITADSTRAIPNTVSTRKVFDNSGLMPIICIALLVMSPCQIATPRPASPTARPAPM